MATLTNTSKSVLGPFTPTKTVLGASDVITWTSGQNAELIMYNITASPVVVTLDGSGVTTVAVPGAGATTVSLAAGLAITVPADGFQIVRLDTVSAYLAGTIALTGGTGVIACITYQ